MKIQPILELKGVRIELTLEEAEKVARSPATGAERIQQEIKMLVNLHHSEDNEGAIIPAADPWIREDGTRPSQDKKKLAAPKRPKPKREACDFCGGFYVAGRGMAIHLKRCEAKAKSEDEGASDRGVLANFVPDEPS